jgi:hypothetical protein
MPWGTNYPDKETNNWSDLVVGGSYGGTLLATLWEDEILSNGSFEDELSAIWTDDLGSAVRTDLGTLAMDGNYVLDASGRSYVTCYFSSTNPRTGLARGLKKLCITGYMKIDPTLGVSAKCRVYPHSATTRNGSPPRMVELYWSTAYNDTLTMPEDGWSQWIKFYMFIDGDTYVDDYWHIEFSSAADFYVDQLKVHEIKEVYELDCPNHLRLNWQRLTDSNYTMADLSKKDYNRGWRPNYTLGYDYCSREEMVKHIDISENGLCFLAPHRDSINGDYVRMETDFDSSYYQDKYIGHKNALVFTGVYPRKFKNREWDYNSWSFSTTG